MVKRRSSFEGHESIGIRVKRLKLEEVRVKRTWYHPYRRAAKKEGEVNHKLSEVIEDKRESRLPVEEQRTFSLLKVLDMKDG